MNTQFNERNISMVMDMYELTMSNGYLNKKCHNTMAAFDVFYRTNPDNAGFAIFAGLEQVIEYIQNLHFGEEDIAYLRSRNLFTEEFLDYLLHFEFQGDIYAMPEGTIMYPNEPVMTVVAPMIDAQLIETAVLLRINHQSGSRRKRTESCVRRTGNRYLISARGVLTMWMRPCTGQGLLILAEP